MKIPELYQKQYIDRQFERADLFKQLQSMFNIKKALYPGSFVHVTPSFYIPSVVYVDSDKNAKEFFADPETIKKFIDQNKIYSERTSYQFLSQDYSLPLEIKENSVDLLISQWAGPISQSCKQYLKRDGKLLANNSHADAGIAFLDPEYVLVCVVNARNGKYSFSSENLDAYFIPKKDRKVTLRDLTDSGKAIAYTKTANFYIFRKLY